MATNEAFGDQENVPDAMPLRRDDLVLEELDGEAILYDPRYGAVHRFNTVTLFVWDTCDGSHTAADVARRLTQLCEVEPDEVLEHVQRVIAELGILELLQNAPVEPMNKRNVPWWTKASPAPAGFSVLPQGDHPEQSRLSRRELLGGGMRKLVFVAPVISTFFAAGAFASPGLCSPCGNLGGCSCTVDADCCGTLDCCGGQCRIPGEGSGCTTHADCCSGECEEGGCN